MFIKLLLISNCYKSETISIFMISEFIKDKNFKQPKKQIRDYVKSKGILTPRVYKDINSAFNAYKNGKDVFLRSEHEQELRGASGLLESYSLKSLNKMEFEELYNFFEYSNNNFFSRKIIDFLEDNTVENRFLELEEKLIKFDSKNIKDYCNSEKIEIEEFISGISFSYWEKLEGINGSIIADDTIENKYHVFQTLSGTYPLTNYTIIQDNKILKENGDFKFQVNNVKIEELINFYNSLKSGNDIPIIEFQIPHTNEDIYFLQYHQMRNFKKPEFKLNKSLENNEIQAEIVRGSTPKEGLELLFRMEKDEKIAGILGVPYYYGSFENELNARSREVQIFSVNSFDMLSHELNKGHAGKSLFFKPKVFFGADVMSLYSLDEISEKEDFRLRVISDGETGYVKRLD